MTSGLVRWLLAALLLGISSLIAYRQALRPNPLQPSSRITTLDWWRYPVERNAFKRLPVIPGDLNDVFSPDGTNVWCVGENGLILISRDGGDRWLRREAGTRQELTSVHFVDAATGWIVGYNGTVLSTADGGQTWQRRTIQGIEGHVRAVQFADRETGWILGQGRLARTQDAGRTWKTVPFEKGREPWTFHFLDRLRGWASENGTVLATTNGGQTWIQVSSPNEEKVYALDVFDASRGWGVESDTVLATVDGGRTWSTQASLDLGQEQLQAVDFVAPDHGWAVGDKGTVVLIQGGKVQVQRSLWDDAALNAVHFADQSRGWVVGEKGALLATLDGGRTWIQKSADANTAFMSLSLIDSSFGWAATQRGNILATRNGGRTWEALSTVDGGIMKIHFVDRRRGWATGEKGIFSTEDGGESWRQATLPVQMFGLSLDFLDSSTGWASGSVGEAGEAESAVLLATEDGGRTWKIRNDESDLLASDLDFQDHEHGWLVSGDELYVTQDRGQTWSEAFSTRPRAFISYLLFVQFIDSKHGWVAGMEGIWGTRDGGSTWKDQETEWIFDVHFQDRLTGWAITKDGALLSTQDGETWLPQRFGTAEKLGTIHFADRDHGVAAGAHGTLLWTDDGGRTWSSVRHERWPAPWYYLTWILAAFVLTPALRRPVTLPEEPSTITDSLSSDRPIETGDPDPLDFQATAEGISKFLRNEATQPPVTIAITGAWGTGKSSLMNLVRGDLAERGFCPVWFNAWHHQQEESLLAALLQAVRRQAIPRWWRPEAWIFRANLLKIRGWRHWAPLLVASALFAFSLAFVTRGDAGEALPRVTEQVEAVAKRAAASIGLNVEKGETPSAGETSAVLLLIGSLAALLRGFWNAASAFGANPSDLLTSAVKGARVRDLQAQTAFRQQFAAEFEDVAQALAPRRMTLFIDDLDRCQPQNVLQVLEAINFLVSSGDCFVIIGLARQQVEAAVGLGFKEIADELVHLEAVRDPIADQDEAEMGRRKRAEFARQYLHKLINLEVAVPDPSPDQRCDLLSGERDETASESSNVAGWLARQGARLAHLAPMVLFLLVLAGAVLAGRFLSLEPMEETPPAQPPVPAATSTPAPPQSKTVPGREILPDLPPTPPEKAQEEESGPAFIEPQAGRRHELPLAVPLVVALLAAAGWILTRRPDTVVRDSPAFKEALRTWFPVIAQTHPTPRSLKRFLNRLRYLAMRQRKEPKKPPLWKALAELWKQKKKDSETDRLLPEDSLVALAALEALDSRIFREHPSLDLGSLQNAFPAFSKVFGEHRELQTQGLFRGQLPLSLYREEFLKISAGVRTG